MRYLNKKVVIVGGSGFIGTQIALRLQKEGATVAIIDIRPSPLSNVAYVKSDLQTIPNFEILQHPFVVFNLAGAPIFARWNKKYKEKIRTSRIDTTYNLIEKFKDEIYKPEFFVSTSAIGVYGDRGNDILNEDSKTIQNTYLAQVAYDWEKEALKGKDLNIQVRIIRNAHVLGKGGILSVLKKIFKTGLGGSLGNGQQYMSFVSIEKCVDAYIDAPFTKSEIKNAVSIKPLTNAEFSKKLAQILKTFCIFRIPVWGMFLVYGDFAKEIITSQRVYTIHNPQTEDLEEIIKRT